MTPTLRLCIHGHFYQPPRENPWLEEIELQESARPFHDWNERVHSECYMPNTFARILDAKGRIINIVNNFEKMSFNCGPTLLSWMEEKDPETYERILKADRESLKHQKGHGNAFAQAYHHTILPLANRRDKVTQIKWGIADFEKRFGRRPESLWLPETACDEETLEVLVEEGIRFIVLSPYQAEAVRPLKSEHWQNVSGGEINPKHAYRIFLKKSPQEHIDVFFYDGPISRDVGFKDLAFEAQFFANRIQAAASGANDCELIHIATDGETYGHHKAFGERALAYLLNTEALTRGFAIVNYGRFLEDCPPEFEVKLKEGANHEGTSWSCVHGVGRWKENCGCHTGGLEGWNQEWRKPLRETLIWLRDEAEKVFISEGSRYLSNPWEARNDYISVVLDRSEESVQKFLNLHGSKNLDKNEKVTVLKLLEMQRHAMMMFTSCGWFFSEISGVETVQILQYAARVIQILEELTNKTVEETFLGKLEAAKSNLPEYKNGRGVYDRLVRPKKMTPGHFASLFAIASLFENYFTENDSAQVYSTDFRILHSRKESFGDVKMGFGRVLLKSLLTHEETDVIFICIQMGLYDFRCSLTPFRSWEELEKLETTFFEHLHMLHMVELVRKMDDSFGKEYFSLKDLPVEDRTKMISILTHEMIEKLSVAYENLYEENRRMGEIYRSINLPAPPEVLYAVQHTLVRRVKKELILLAEEGFVFRRALPIYRLLEVAKSFQVEIIKEETSQFFTEELEKRIKNLGDSPKIEIVLECIHLEKIARKMGVPIHKRSSQDVFFKLMQKWIERPALLKNLSKEQADSLLQLCLQLNFNNYELKRILVGE